jgi:hypothetical protein
MIQQITEEIKKQIEEHATFITRLDSVFTHVDQKYSEADNARNLVAQTLNAKHDIITDTLNNVSNGLTSRIDNVSSGLALRVEQLSMEIRVLQQAERNRAQPDQAQPPIPPPGISTPSTSAVPPQPSSWTNAVDPNQAQPNPFAAPNGSSLSRPTMDPSPPNAPSFGAAPLPRENTEHYNLSPGSPLTSATPVAQQPPNQPSFYSAPAASSLHKPFDVRDWSTDGMKISKELKTYNGDLATFDVWRTRIRNHFVSKNANYSKIFEIIEKNKIPIPLHSLSNTRIPELPNIDWCWIATHLWTFTGNFLSDDQLTHRMTLVAGEEFNGVEYWRALFNQNVGGSSQMINLERGHFIAFPRCSDIATLEPHLKQWISLRNKYGAHLPEEHLISMFWNIIPEHMREEIKRQKHLTGQLQPQIDWVFSEISERSDATLSKWNLAKLHQQLKPHSKNTTGIHAIPVNESATTGATAPPPPVPDMATLTATIERTVNAALSRNGRPPNRTPPGSRSASPGAQRAGRRIPSATFNGCWCCGKPDHKRGDCPDFKKLLKDNGGRVPKNYVGAWEKSIKKPPTKPVAVLGIDESDDIPTGEHDETVRLWPVLPRPPPVDVTNAFDALAEDDSDDEESELVKALAALTPNISRQSDRRPQSMRKSQKSERPLNIGHLNAVARDVRAGKISLPELDLSNNDDFTYVWALVDSGAGANCARRNAFPLSEKTDAPDISLSTANGELLPNNGACRVTAYTRDGGSVDRVFYDTNVEMPILAVSEISREGVSGSEVRLRQKDGYIRDLHTGRTQPIVKRRGVYFTKMFIRKRPVNASESDFVRPAQR